MEVPKNLAAYSRALCEYLGFTRFSIIRSLTALAILSTATLELHLVGNVIVMTSTRFYKSAFTIFITMLLAAGEILLWCLPEISQRLIAQYLGFKCVLLPPVVHQASINGKCAVDIIDLQVVCSTGTLVIGSVSQLSKLIASSFGISFLFYLYHRWRISISKHSHPSSLLSCGAQFLFRRIEWVYDDLYYIDYSSAVLIGLITIPTPQNLYIFDVKTWRI
ncbi:hypothetical protein THRCLA_04245 [Thraustotheca clavata]|uniref:Transmembrane protein n=1 Tax=Thraustotheca clavata TaxID=74557 RepID=A0A1V9ZZL6_9STRA|nr:hypothetical protein THRCLA_04245 [Thraustotheca clavata]